MHFQLIVINSSSMCTQSTSQPKCLSKLETLGEMNENVNEGTNKNENKDMNGNGEGNENGNRNGTENVLWE